MEIKVFSDKAKALYHSLKQYEGVIRQATADVSEEKINGPWKWFNPDTVHLNPHTMNYPKPRDWQHDRDLVPLILTVHNYPALLIINHLYQNQKDVAIEDACSGIGQLIFYLSKLGFTKFHNIDNFCQVPQRYFDRMMNNGNIKCALNDLNFHPKVSVISTYPIYPKKKGQDGKPYFDGTPCWEYGFKPVYIDKETELFGMYNKSMDKMPEQLKAEGFEYICTDTHELMFWYARYRVEEIKQRLKELC